MKNLKWITLVIVLLLLTSCAHNTGIQCETTSHIYGFWGGFWHGFILPFSWFGSLFSDSIVIYSISNNGGWYDFGFVLALGGVSQIIGIISKTVAAILK
jgi:hypothetical protein